jgi:hypothetical protein
MRNNPAIVNFGVISSLGLITYFIIAVVYIFADVDIIIFILCAFGFKIIISVVLKFIISFIILSWWSSSCCSSAGFSSISLLSVLLKIAAPAAVSLTVFAVVMVLKLFFDIVPDLKPYYPIRLRQIYCVL